MDVIPKELIEKIKILLFVYYAVFETIVLVEVVSGSFVALELEQAGIIDCCYRPFQLLKSCIHCLELVSTWIYQDCLPLGSAAIPALILSAQFSDVPVHRH